ncbi:hypothetical protein BGZ73_006797 [Actinomortierella ambigua]|nr:hypothetical protein BGZ73_006797 [Actinomortierella ambigua]
MNQECIPDASLEAEHTLSSDQVQPYDHVASQVEAEDSSVADRVLHDSDTMTIPMPLSILDSVSEQDTAPTVVPSTLFSSPEREKTSEGQCAKLNEEDETGRWSRKAATEGRPDPHDGRGPVGSTKEVFQEGRNLRATSRFLKLRRAVLVLALLVLAVIHLRRLVDSQIFSDVSQHGDEVMCGDDRGVEQTYVKTVEIFECYTEAANQGNANAQFHLGQMYEDGRGVRQNFVEAVKWYSKAANQGHPRGQSSLGFMYSKGRGVEQNDALAIEWYTKAAKQGDPRGQYNLGVRYETGQGVRWDDGEALRLYTLSANQGFAGAQYALGDMYFRGEVIRQNYTVAVMWYTRAAEQGFARAQLVLGEMYFFGTDVGQNYVEAVKWFTKAATQGDPDAQFMLGTMYEYGQGAEQNDAEAIKWLTKAAEQGYLPAEDHLDQIFSRNSSQSL